MFGGFLFQLWNFDIVLLSKIGCISNVNVNRKQINIGIQVRPYTEVKYWITNPVSNKNIDVGWNANVYMLKKTKTKLSKQFDSRVDNVANFKVSKNMSFAYPHVL